MFAFIHKKSIRMEYDRKLLYDVQLAYNEWSSIRSNGNLLFSFDSNNYIVNEKLAKLKYEFLFREARHRKIKATIQESMIKH